MRLPRCCATTGRWWPGKADFNRIAVPVAIQGKVVGISTGFAHTVALLGDGTVATWGYGGEERLNVPTNLPTGIVAVAAGNTHNLVLTHEGRVVSWATPATSEIWFLPMPRRTSGRSPWVTTTPWR